MTSKIEYKLRTIIKNLKEIEYLPIKDVEFKWVHNELGKYTKLWIYNDLTPIETTIINWNKTKLPGYWLYLTNFILSILYVELMEELTNE